MDVDTYFLIVFTFYLSSNHPNERPNDEEDKPDSQAAKTNHLKSNLLFHTCHHYDAIYESFQLFTNIYNSFKSFNFW